MGGRRKRGDRHIFPLTDRPGLREGKEWLKGDWVGTQKKIYEKIVL